MPPKVKITREQILEAAYALVRQEGPEKLTVRAVAQMLECSTQPVLYQFASVEELRKAVYEKADAYHSEYIQPREGRNPLLSLGLNYIRFGQEEPMLFRFLFQTDQFRGATLDGLMEDPAMLGMLQMVASQAGCSLGTAKDVFLNLFISAHGYASLLANNAMVYDEQNAERILLNAFAAFRRKE